MNFKKGLLKFFSKPTGLRDICKYNTKVQRQSSIHHRKYSTIPSVQHLIDSTMALVRNLHRLISIAKIHPNVNSSVLKNSNRINFGRAASTTQPLQEKQEEVKVTFIRASGERIEVKGKIGDTLLDIVVNNEIDLDGYGACEGTLTCSTCHLIFPKDVYDKLPDKPTDEENDMLDLASGLTDTSRLGCQIVLTRDMDGLEVQVPPTLYDARS